MNFSLTAANLSGGNPNPDRAPPCTAQPLAVQWAIKICALLIPGLCYGLVCTRVFVSA
jgi:hypothetical protein